MLESKAQHAAESSQNLIGTVKEAKNARNLALFDHLD